MVAGRKDRNGAEQLLQASDAGEVEGEIGAARQGGDLPEGRLPRRGRGPRERERPARPAQPSSPARRHSRSTFSSIASPIKTRALTLALPVSRIACSSTRSIWVWPPTHETDRMTPVQIGRGIEPAARLALVESAVIDELGLSPPSAAVASNISPWMRQAWSQVGSRLAVASSAKISRPSVTPAADLTVLGSFASKLVEKLCDLGARLAGAQRRGAKCSISHWLFSSVDASDRRSILFCLPTPTPLLIRHTVTNRRNAGDFANLIRHNAIAL